MEEQEQALLDSFEQEYGRRATQIALAPGRVNMIGDHTDYNDGFVLPMAIDRSVRVAAAARDDGTVHVWSKDYEERDEFPLEGQKRSGSWKDYVRGVFWSLKEAGHPVKGVDLAIESDLPQRSGLSSSAAVELAVAAAATAVSEVVVEDRDLAQLAQRAENEFVRVQCGIMDQLAIVYGRAGHALLVDCQSLEVSHVPIGEEADFAVTVIDSGVSRDLSKKPYNERREECAEATRQLGVKSLRDANESWLRECQHRMPDELFRRARHVLTENERVVQTAEALRRQDLATVGKRMYQSHASLRDDFEVSTPELDSLVEIGRRTEGVWGARLTGAGFGGSVVALTRPEASDDLAERVLREYASPSGDAATVSVLRASNGLKVTRV
jgi:galactokinase